MAPRTYFLISAFVFGLAAVLHLSRLIYHWSIALGGWSAPVWMSAPGLLGAGIMCLWGIQLAMGRSRAR